jgi:hypothetical protein
MAYQTIALVVSNHDAGLMMAMAGSLPGLLGRA